MFVKHYAPNTVCLPLNWQFVFTIYFTKVSNFTEKWKNQSKFQNSIFLPKFDRKFSKVDQVIYASAPTSMPNMKALAQILFEISCTQDFQILFSKGHNSEKGQNSNMKKIRVNYFFMRYTYMKFQIPSMHHSEVNRNTDRQTDRQAESNIPFQLFQSWGHKNRESYNKNVYQAFTKGIFNMVIHKYSHVVQNIFL